MLKEQIKIDIFFPNAYIDYAVTHALKLHLNLLMFFKLYKHQNTLDRLRKFVYIVSTYYHTCFK